MIMGSACAVPGTGWCITSVFFVEMVRLMFVQAFPNKSMLCCISASVLAIRAVVYEEKITHSYIM